MSSIGKVGWASNKKRDAFAKDDVIYYFWLTTWIMDLIHIMKYHNAQWAAIKGESNHI